MARNVPSWISLSGLQQAELAAVVSSGSGWQLLSKESLPGVFRDSFKAKTDSCIMIVSGSSSSATVLVFNALRVDAKAGAIDQEPFAVALSGSTAPVSGVFVHHGSWASRSFDPGEPFWSAVSASGVGNYFLANPPSGATSGPLSSLPFGSRGAFESAVSALRAGA